MIAGIADTAQQMVSYGLNTVRIPVGYWFLEDIVDNGEHFPQGGEAYLDQVVGWAKDAGLYVILGLHGAPGAQVTDPFTGQLNPDPAFYNDHNYDRAYQWLEWMTNKIHTDTAYSTVGMLELVNEPERSWATATYPDAKANSLSVREVSSRLDSSAPSLLMNQTRPTIQQHGPRFEPRSPLSTSLPTPSCPL